MCELVDVETPTTVEFLGSCSASRELCEVPVCLLPCNQSSVIPAATRRNLFLEREETGNGKISCSLGSTRGSVFSTILGEFSLKVNG